MTHLANLLTVTYVLGVLVSSRLAPRLGGRLTILLYCVGLTLSGASAYVYVAVAHNGAFLTSMIGGVLGVYLMFPFRALPLVAPSRRHDELEADFYRITGRLRWVHLITGFPVVIVSGYNSNLWQAYALYVVVIGLIRTWSLRRPGE